MRRARVAAAALIALALALAGCGGAKPPAKKPLGTLRIGLVGAPATINPLLVQDASGAEVDSLVYDGLVRVSPQLAPEPDLAQSWTVSPDGRQYTFRLNPRAIWQDGTPVTAADVVFSYAAYRDPRNGSPVAIDLREVQQVTAPSKHTVVFLLAHPFSPFLLDIAPLPILPVHVLGALQPGASLNDAPALTTKPVGSGPFRLSADRQGEYVLRRNASYFLGAPHLDSLDLLVEASAGDALSALRQGKLDFAPVPGPDVSAVATWHNVSLRSTTGLGYAALVWNTSDRSVQSPALRRALYYAIDRHAVIQAALGGRGLIANGPVPPHSWAYDPSLPQRPYDPATARAQLAALGDYVAKDGSLRESSGAPVRLAILANRGDPVRTAALQVIVDDLRGIGIAASVQYEDWHAYLQDLVTGNFQVALVERGMTPDPDIAPFFGSAAVNTSGRNVGDYHNTAVDRALVAERSATSQAKRAQALHLALEAMAADPPALFLYFPDYVDALSRAFGNYEPSPLGNFYAPENWRAIGR